MDPRPAGFFDSGVGGLSVLGAFRALAPGERVVYFADTAYFPYGPRPAAEIRKRSFAVVQRLLESRVKIVVVACNTASAAAIEDLRAAFPVPFVGMVPGVKPAAHASASGHVAILATDGTFDGELYSRVVEEFGKGARITSIPGRGLAELVENGGAGSPEARVAIREAIGPAVAAGADAVVLGCTHYTFLADDIAAEFPGLTIVDTSEAVARRAVSILKEMGLEAPPGQAGELDVIVSGDRAGFYDAMERLGFRHRQGAAR